MKRISIALLMLSLLLTSCQSSANTNTSNITTVKNETITIKVNEWNDDGQTQETEKLKGKYTGKLKDGKPYGKGTLKWKNSDNEKRIYKGEFKKGTINGYGKTICYDNDTTYNIEGKYTNGAFTPTKSELIDCFLKIINSKLDDSSYYADEMTTTSMDFIDSHDNYFPVDLNNKPEDYDSSIIQADYKKMTKSLQNYNENLVTDSNLYINNIFEDYYFGYQITDFFISNNADCYYYGFYFGSVEKYDDDSITSITYLPLSTGTVELTDGTSENVIYILASSIQ